MKKGIDDQLASGGQIDRISISTVADFTKLLPAHITTDHSSNTSITNSIQKKERLIKITVSDRQLIDIIEDSWKAIQIANQHKPVIFSGYGTLVQLSKKQVIQGWPEEHMIEIMSLPQIFGRLLRAALWVSVKDRGGQLVESPDRPPKDCATDLLTFPVDGLPRLESVILSPRYNTRGELIFKTGYHEADGIFFDPIGNLKLDEIPKIPSIEDVELAKKIIFEEVYPNFPFVGQSDLVHAIAKPLAIIGRRLINGPTPLHLVEAKQHGTGKGLLDDVSSIITSGRSSSVSTLPTNEAEVKKFITSLLISGTEEVVLDNADDKHPLHSPNLAAVLTSTIWTDRILGLSKNISVPNLATWSLTGNNVRLSGELARRSIRSRLDAKTDRPWLRPDSEFKHPRLKEWVLQNRGLIFWAYIILIENWKSKGRPRGKKRLGSYEAYCEFIGGVLEAAGINGFLDDLHDFYATADTDGQDWREFTESWWKKFNGLETTVKDLNKLCEDEDLLVEVRGPIQGQSQLTKLGLKLKTMPGRCFGNLIIEAGKANGNKGRLYKLMPNEATADVATSPEAPSTGPLENLVVESSGCKIEGDLGDLIKPFYNLEKNPSVANNHNGHNAQIINNAPTVPACTLNSGNDLTNDDETKIKPDAPTSPPLSPKMEKKDYENI